MESGQSSGVAVAPNNNNNNSIHQYQRLLRLDAKNSCRASTVGQKLQSRRKSEYFLPDETFYDGNSSKNDYGSPTTRLRTKSPSIPFSSQLENLNLNLSKIANRNYSKQNESSSKHYSSQRTIFDESSSSHHQQQQYRQSYDANTREIANNRFHEKSPSWPQQADIVNSMSSSSVGEKLFKIKQRPERGSFCKSTISSHDSGIGMQDDIIGCSATVTPVVTPTACGGINAERIFNSHCSLTSVDKSTTQRVDNSPIIDDDDSNDQWFGTSTPILKGKFLNRSEHAAIAGREDIPLIDENPPVLLSGHKNPTSPDYDSETLRKSAQRNREIAARLLPKLTQQQQQRCSPRESVVVNKSSVDHRYRLHERQLSLDGQRDYRHDQDDSPRAANRCYLTKSPSQASFGGSSSIYTNSSNGTISTKDSTGDAPPLMFTSLHHDLKSYHDEHQEHLIKRSLSIDTIGSEFLNSNINAFVESANAPPYLTYFNKPHQRNNIAGLYCADKELRSPVIVREEETEECFDANQQSVCREMARSMPNLNRDNAVDDESDELENKPIRIQANKIDASPSVSSNLKRSESPIYAVPVKSKRLYDFRLYASSLEMKPPPLPKKPPPAVVLQHQRMANKNLCNNDIVGDGDRGKVITSNSSANVRLQQQQLFSKDSNKATSFQMSTSVDDLRQRCNGAAGDYNRRTAAVDSVNVGLDNGNNRVISNNSSGGYYNKNQNVVAGGIRTAVLPSSSSAVHRNSNESHSSFNTNHSRTTQAPTSKRPVVPVHPYNEQDELVVRTTFNNHLNISFIDEKSSRDKILTSPLSPRPPVPPKPEKISVAKPPPHLPPKPSSSSSSSDSGCNVPLRRPPVVVEQRQQRCVQQEHQQQAGAKGLSKCEPLDDDDDDMSRRSRIVAENSNDAGLIDILVGQQRQSVDYISIVFDRSRPHTSFPLCASDRNREVGAEATSAVSSVNTEPATDVCSTGDKSSSNVEKSPCIKTPLDLEKEKKNLIASLSSKLAVLKKMLREVEHEIRYNDCLGQTLRTVIETSASSSHDKDSFRLHIEDTEKITHLLLKLSAQLARVENDLNRMPVTCSPKEKHHLTERRQRLMVQLQDAKCLKEDLDGRGDNVLTVLRNILDDDALADYRYFIQMKSQLLIDVREIEDKIKLGEDQKKALEESLTNS